MKTLSILKDIKIVVEEFAISFTFPYVKTQYDIIIYKKDKCVMKLERITEPTLKISKSSFAPGL